jgi:protein phosphatase
MKAAYSTNIGKRNNNEDSMFIPRENLPLAAVADGMGGHNAGEIASHMAIDVVSEFIAQADFDLPSAALREAVETANRSIYTHAGHGGGCAGMGTTITAALIGERIVVANVGDSRAYLFSDGKLKRVTRDHSLVEELMLRGEISPEQAAHHPQRNIITRALGAESGVDVDIFELDWAAGDILMLCTDGLSATLEEDEMIQILSDKAQIGRAHV